MTTKLVELAIEKIANSKGHHTWDNDDVINETNIDLRRLGSTNEFGREDLIETYGNRSHHRLEAPELLESLTYLRNQLAPQKYLIIHRFRKSLLIINYS